jgi:hypothetical protein
MSSGSLEDGISRLEGGVGRVEGSVKVLTDTGLQIP